MAALMPTVQLPDLTPIAPGGEGAEGDARPVFTWQADAGTTPSYRLLRSSVPSDGGPPRLVAEMYQIGTGTERCLAVWDSGTGALLMMLEQNCTSLVTYQRPSDGRSRVAAGTTRGQLHIWDGDDFRLVTIIQRVTAGGPIPRLIVYHDPASGKTRLVTE
jgi:WD40 repeat protein